MSRFLVLPFLLLSCNSVDIDDCLPALKFKFSIAGTWDTPSLSSTIEEGNVTFDSNGSGSTTESSVFDDGSLDFGWEYKEEDETLTIGDKSYQVIEITCVKATFMTDVRTFSITR